VGGEDSTARQARLALVVLIAVVVTVGCGESGANSDTGRVANRPAGVLALTGDGITGARIGAPAVAAQKAAARVLGKPDETRFGGCELAGPEAVYGQIVWSWGALSLTFGNRATTPKVVPGRFLGWHVRATGSLPRLVRLPPGIGMRSSRADVLAATPVASAGEGLPGTYEIRGADGVYYTFLEPYRHIDYIAVNPQLCE
jgi:hypothetical protein